VNTGGWDGKVTGPSHVICQDFATLMFRMEVPE
jgi:hypothetical protein